jgi:hypothetical protein
MSTLLLLSREIQAACLGLFLVPLLLPRWKWLLRGTLIFITISVALWAEYIYTTAQDNFTGSPGEPIGLLFYFLFNLSFALGLGLRLAVVYILFQTGRRLSIAPRAGQPSSAPARGPQR